MNRDARVTTVEGSLLEVDRFNHKTKKKKQKEEGKGKGKS